MRLAKRGMQVRIAIVRDARNALCAMRAVYVRAIPVSEGFVRRAARVEAPPVGFDEVGARAGFVLPRMGREVTRAALRRMRFSGG
ncbi:hypothetical protein GCM10027093_26080 [Paraburkholderia jirisanensis]